MNRYRDLYKASLTDPASFWAEGGARGDLNSRAAADSRRHPAAALPLVPDAELNSCANALDRHVDGGRGGQAALIYDSPVTESQRTITYSTPLHVSPAR